MVKELNPIIWVQFFKNNHYLLSTYIYEELLGYYLLTFIQWRRDFQLHFTDEEADLMICLGLNFKQGQTKIGSKIHFFLEP